MWKKCRGMREALRKPRKRDAPGEDKCKRLSKEGFLNSLQGFIEDGAFSKAVKHLISDGLHDGLDQEVRKELRRLHPTEDPVTGAPMGKPWPKADSDDERRAFFKTLKETILGFPLGSAAGPSGLRPPH